MSDFGVETPEERRRRYLRLARAATDTAAKTPLHGAKEMYLKLAEAWLAMADEHEQATDEHQQNTDEHQQSIDEHQQSTELSIESGAEERTDIPPPPGGLNVKLNDSR